MAMTYRNIIQITVMVCSIIYSRHTLMKKPSFSLQSLLILPIAELHTIKQV